MDPVVARLLVIRGRVQGVGFRHWTVTVAREHGLRGWVRNLEDGSVEALLVGPAELVAKVEERCRRGPRLAVVESIDAEAVLNVEEFPGFSARVD